MAATFNNNNNNNPATPDINHTHAPHTQHTVIGVSQSVGISLTCGCDVGLMLQQQVEHALCVVREQCAPTPVRFAVHPWIATVTQG